MPRRSQRPPTRLIKWVGDPRRVKADGWSIPGKKDGKGWKYENNRVLVIEGDTRFERHLRKDDGCDYELDSNGRPILSKPIKGTGIKHDYDFDGRNNIVEMTLEDAMIVLEKQGYEFKDVTDSAHPEEVTNDLIIVDDRSASLNISRA
jgi:hypothetical protein